MWCYAVLYEVVVVLVYDPMRWSSTKVIHLTSGGSRGERASQSMMPADTIQKPPTQNDVGGIFLMVADNTMCVWG